MILTGIGTGMVACICTPAPRKHEFLLYCTVSVLVLNVLNLIYLEFGQLRELFGEHVHERFGREFDLLEAPTARLITTGTAALLVCVAFAEAQLNFYLLHRCQRAHRRRRSAERKTRQLYAGNDQSADLEYVIPKVCCASSMSQRLYLLIFLTPPRVLKSDLHHQKSITSDPRVDVNAVQVHNKSWVFEATGDEDDDANFDESSVSLCSSVSPSHSAAPNGGGSSLAHHQQQQPHHQVAVQPAQPATGAVNATAGQHQRQRRISRVSDAASERFAMQMSSFSRCATPSPVPRSGTQSPAHGAASSLFSPYSDYLDPVVVKAPPAASSFAAHHKVQHAPADSSAGGSSTTTNNRLTVDFLAAATAKLKPVTGSHPSQLPPAHAHGPDASLATSGTDPTSMTTQPDDSPYASLLAELEHSLHEKMAAHSSFSPDNTSLSTSDNKFSSKSASSSKDLEFSKELEAALQLIQELETPSEGPYLGDAQLLHHHQIAAIAAGSGGVGTLPVGTSLLARSDSEKTLSAAVSLPSPEAGPLVDTSSTPTGGSAALSTAQLSASTSMHRLVIDVRAATTTPTTPISTDLRPADGSPSTATTTPTMRTAPQVPTHSTNGKHVFSVFCSDRNGGGGGSQSTSGYSSPSSSSHMASHSVRDSCETTHSDHRVLLNSFGAANVIHIQASKPVNQSQPSGRYFPGHYPSHYQQPRSTSTTVASSDHNGTTMFINTLSPAPNSIEQQHQQPERRSSATSTSSASTYEYRNPVAMTASPASRSTSSTHATGAAHPASKSFLLFKKRSKLMPQPDFQSRIFKSECLAYLTDEELLQRHQLNRNVIRVRTTERHSGCGTQSS